MLPQEILRQVRRLQIRARRAVEDLLGGEYHSVFKGSGIAFEEVRAYQPGDDVRAIDWNVTARMGQPFIKRFIEERELTVFLVVDCSASQQFGTARQFKRETAAELAAILAFTAVTNNDKVGFMAVSDRVERFVPPRKGTRHVLRIIRDVLFFEPEHRGTSLRRGLDFLNRVLRRRSIVFLLSDFLDDDFEQAFRRTANRHDLIAIHLSDPREREWPDMGLVEFEDLENGRQYLVDTSRNDFRRGFAESARKRLENLRHVARSSKTDLIEVTTDGSHLDALHRFFRLREHRAHRS